MVNRTLVGLLAAAAGVAVAAISALANQLDIGEEGFGWKQTAGVFLGAALVLAGTVILARRSRRSLS